MKLNTIEMLNKWAENGYRGMYKMVESTFEPLLEEPIKAFYSNGNTMLSVNGNNREPLYIVDPLTTFWEEVKPPRRWNKKELMLFEIFPWAKWIVQERNGDIELFENKPEYEFQERNWFADGESKTAIISTDDIKEISTITFEESPIYIDDLKGE